MADVGRGRRLSMGLREALEAPRRPNSAARRLHSIGWAAVGENRLELSNDFAHLPTKIASLQAKRVRYRSSISISIVVLIESVLELVSSLGTPVLLRVDRISKCSVKLSASLVPSINLLPSFTEFY